MAKHLKCNQIEIVKIDDENKIQTRIASSSQWNKRSTNSAYIECCIMNLKFNKIKYSVDSVRNHSFASAPAPARAESDSFRKIKSISTTFLRFASSRRSHPTIMCYAIKPQFPQNECFSDFWCRRVPRIRIVWAFIKYSAIKALAKTSEYIFVSCFSFGSYLRFVCVRSHSHNHRITIL